jgi:hypothetical protein
MARIILKCTLYKHPEDAYFTYRLRVNPAIACSVHSNKVLVSVNADFFIN